MKNSNLIISVTLIALSFSAQAKENVGAPLITPTTGQNRSLMSGCAPATAQVDLDINNVRAKLFTGGDMWWDLIGTARYYVPKPDKNAIGPSSQFATSLWVGGYDAGGVLKVAAMTYRQTGNDYWPGPLTSLATTDAATCIAWDKFYKIDRQDVANYAAWIANPIGPNPVSANAMDVINNWPVLGPEGQPLAPYYDANSNGIYDPDQGDYPDFDVTGTRPPCSAQLFGDESIWWVFNDKGNTHTETGGQPIGLEIQEQAFAFKTNDEINDMTFYKYKVINKSSFRLDSTFFGIWDDADLGFAFDDYVGCDVGLGLGMCFNGTSVDGSGQVTSYGANPPAVGIDFFEGPFADSNGIDDPASKVPASFLHYGDGIPDNERLGMGKFVYYVNDYTPKGNPTLATHYYGYLTATWKDATRFTYGGDGHISGGPFCNYMFPGASDPTGFGTAGIPQAPWDETSSKNVPADRRFLESAGPFKLKPGAVNYVTLGVPWARATQGGNLASVALLKGADTKAQQLFNNCFSTLNGPDAPNLAIQELDKELILSWSNPRNSNNYQEKYFEDYDKSTGSDSLYRFQGYQIFQLKDGSVSAGDLTNIDKARLVFQCDKADGVAQIVNYKKDLLLSALVPIEMVNGLNKGIIHSKSITTDLFATGDDRLINHKTYYYTIIAYGFSPTQVPVNLNQLNDYNPYIAGRHFADPLFQHTAIPHIPTPEAGGTEQHSIYGSGPKLIRIEGKGNGGNILDITDETAAQIIASPASRALNPVYQGGRGPVSIKVIDPLNVPAADFKFLLYTNGNINPANLDTARWELDNLTTGEKVKSETTIKLPNEQVINGQPTHNNDPSKGPVSIPKWGISVSATTASDPGFITSTPLIYPLNNGFLEATMTFSDKGKQWLTGVADQEGLFLANWIRSGTAKDPLNPQYDDYAVTIDDQQNYEKVLGGMWAPYRLCAYTTVGTGAVFNGGPAWNNSLTMTQNKMKNLASVDVIITSDKSKWTRCPVLEEQEDKTLAIGGAVKLNMRNSASVDKNGSSNPGPDNNDYPTGMGWFPGYAINLETGERLNMAFGEDSWLVNDNGADMKWNPTSTQFSGGNSVFGGSSIFGGKHYIYVFGHNADQNFAASDPNLPFQLKDVPRYDGGKVVHNLLRKADSLGGSVGDPYKREAFIDAMWVNIPLLASGHGLLETDVKVRLRVTKSYQKYGTGVQVPVTQKLVKDATYFLENGAVVYAGKNILTGNSFVADSVGTPSGTGDYYTISGSSNPLVPSVLTTINGANPMCNFNTADLETKTSSATSAKDALSLINIVPNPYYAYSSYEHAALDLTDGPVKITNLPAKCTISIYTLSGTLIRKIKKDDGDTKSSANWDLKNTANIPVASGLYIIYVDVPGVGSKTLKWFGVMRPQDLDSY